MRAVEMDFFPRAQTRGDESGQFDDTLLWFIGILQKDGHLLDNSDVVLELSDRVQVRAIAAADDALDQANWNVYALKCWADLKAMSIQKPQLRLIQENDDGDAACSCDASSSLMLFTTHLATTSPIDCMDCKRPIPLYRLPHLNQEDEHWTLRQWENQYKTLDQLYMNSWWGERMAYHQLSNPRSGFINDSRKVARELEKKVKKPVYVFLLHVYQQWGETCPRCNRDWIWNNTPSPLFHFKCDYCRLVSQEATSEATPLSELHP